MFRPVSIVSSLMLASVAVAGHFSAPLLAAEAPTADIYDVCEAGDGGAAMFLHVQNIRSVEGNLRAQVYSADPDEFLAKGKKLVRVDVPVRLVDKQSVCVPVPAPGTYAFVVMHDRNANGKADFFSEGFGFSNNPTLGFGPPDSEEVLIDVPAGVGKMTINLKYLLGDDDGKKEKRRKLKRR